MLAEAARLELKRLQEEQSARKADTRQATAQLEIQETLLKNSEVVAPMDGVILVKSAEPGEVLAAGTTVVTLGDLAKPWLRAYINEQDLGRVKLGAEVKVTTDSFPGKTYLGRISFIASDAEFTPKQIQTQEERVKLVYRVKIDVENPAGELKSNMPADAADSAVSSNQRLWVGLHDHPRSVSASFPRKRESRRALHRDCALRESKGRLGFPPRLTIRRVTFFRGNDVSFRHDY